MGRSKEELLLQNVKKIDKSFDKWKNVVQAFLDDVPYGSPIKCKDRKVVDVLFALLEHLNVRGTSSDILLVIETLRRLFPVKGVYKNLHKHQFGPLVEQLYSDNATLCKEALGLVLYAIEQPDFINRATNGERPEIGIKAQFFKAKGAKVVVDVLYKWAYTDEDDVIIQALKVMNSLIDTHQHTTDFVDLEATIEIFNTVQSQLFDLTRHALPTIRFSAMALVRALLRENPPKQSIAIQNYAREHGLLLWQINFAVSSGNEDVVATMNPKRLSVGFTKPPIIVVNDPVPSDSDSDSDVEDDGGSDIDESSESEAPPPPPDYDPPSEDEDSLLDKPAPPTHAPGERRKPAPAAAKPIGIEVEVSPEKNDDKSDIRVFSPFAEKSEFVPSEKARQRSYTRGGSTAMAMLPSRTKTNPAFKLSSLNTDRENDGIKRDNRRAQADQRRQSRELVGLLVDRNPVSLAVVKRIFPPSLCSKLDAPAARSPREDPVFPNKLNKAQIKTFEAKSKHIVNKHNWSEFFSNVDKNHITRTLMWSPDYRKELRDQLKNEVEDLDIDRVVRNKVVPWDHEGFVTTFESNKSFPRAGPYFLEPLLNDLVEGARLPQPRKLFRTLIKASVVQDDPQRKLLNLRCMHACLDRSFDTLVPKFPMEYMLWSLRTNTDPKIRDAILDLLRLALKHLDSAKLFTTLGGIPIVMRYLCLSHEVQPGPKPVPVHPAALTHRCLRILDLVSDDSRSCKQLARGDYFQYVVQLLLVRTDAEITSATMSLLSKVAKAVPAIQSSLHQTGIFAFILVLCARFCSPTMVEFLAAYHTKQDYVGHGIESGDSYLKLFLPGPVITLLVQSPDLFAEAMNKSISRPDLKWNHQLRQHLADSLVEQLSGFIAEIGSDCRVLYVYQEFTPVSFPSLEVELCVDGIYVAEFNSDETYPVSDPGVMLASFIKAIDDSPLEKAEQLVALLEAQRNLFQRFRSKKEFMNYAGFASLLRLLNLDMREHVQVITAAAALLAVVLAPQQTAVSIHTRVSQDTRNSNISGFLAKEGLRPIASLLTGLTSNEAAGADPTLLYAVLNTVCYVAGHTGSDQYLTEYPEIACQVLHFVLPAERALNQDNALVALDSIPDICKSVFQRSRFLENGALLHMIDIALTEYLDMDSEPSTWAEAASLPVAATRALIALIADTDAAENLSKILTPGVALVLPDISKFLLILRRASTSTPQILWNSQMLSELTAWLSSQVKNQTSGAGDTIASHPVYSSLQDIVVVDGVYLHLFTESPDTPLGPREFYSTFLKSLNSALANEEDRDLSIKAFALQRLLVHHDHLVSEVAITTEPVCNWLNLLSSTDDIEIRAHVLDLLVLVSKVPTAAEAISRDIGLFHYFLYMEPATQRPSRATVIALLVNIFELHPIPLAVRDSGLLLTLCHFFASSSETSVRESAARGIGVLARYLQPHYLDILQVTESMFGPGFEAVVSGACDHPQEFVNFFDSDHFEPNLIWDESMRNQLRVFFESEITPLVSHLRDHHSRGSEAYSWSHGDVPERFSPGSLRNLRVGKYFIKPLLQGSSTGASLLHDRSEAEEYIGLLFQSLDGASRTPDAESTYGNLCDCLKLVLDSDDDLYGTAKLAEHASFLLSTVRENPGQKDVLIDIVLRALQIETYGDSNVFALALEQAHLIPAWLAWLHLFPARQAILLDITRGLICSYNGIRASLRQTGALIYFAWVVLTSEAPEARQAAAECLQVAVSDPEFGDDFLSMLSDILTSNFQEISDLTPEGIVKFFDQDHQTEPGVRWDDSNRNKVRDAFGAEVSRMATACDWDGSSDIFVLRNLPQLE